MKYAVVYSSRTGNTRSLAERIVQVLGKDGCIYEGCADERAYEADTIYVGFWTGMGTCDESISAFLSKAVDKDIFLFGTAGFGGSQEYFSKILGNVKKNMNPTCRLTGSFMCQGRMPASVREKYLRMDPAKSGPMIENFDRALSHPDGNDFKNLEKAVLS